MKTVLWRTEDHDGWWERVTCVVHEDCPAPRPTGLLAADGTPIYRVPERVKFGFQGRPE